MRLDEKIFNSGNFELNELLSHAKAEVSYLGTRYVTANGYEGSVELDTLAFNVYHRSKKPYYGAQFGVEGLPGAQCARKVEAFYATTDTMGNIIARFFRYLREFIPDPLGIRFFIEDRTVTHNFLNINRNFF